MTLASPADSTVSSTGRSTMVAVSDSGLSAFAIAHLAIAGMSCAGCARGVTKLLQDVPGVEQADVNFAAEQARIRFDPARTDVAALRAAVDAGGFEAKPLADDEPSVEAGADERARAQLVRVAIAWVPTFALMGVMLYCAVFDMPHNMHHRWLMLALAFPVVFVAGWPTHRGSWAALRRGHPNMDTLISLGTVPTYAAGLSGIPDTTPFVEVAAMVMAFHQLSRYLERRARGKASQAIRQLQALQVKQAHLLVGGKEALGADSESVDVPIKAVQVGDILLVKPGEAIPTDGSIVAGVSSINEAIATGESLPVEKTVGDEAIGATLNQQGWLAVEVTRPGSESFLAQTIRLVQEAQGSKVPVQALADRVTAYFVPAIVVIATLTFVAWALAAATLHPWLATVATVLPWVDAQRSPLAVAAFNAIAVLVVACPCALGLATPVALMVGSGRGAENGILIRHGAAIQTLQSTTRVVLDKTGTVTVGRPQVTVVVPEAERERVLALAAAAERGSEHPLAQAVVRAARDRELEVPSLTSLQTEVGQGIVATVAEQTIAVGSWQFLSDRGLDTAAGQIQVEELEAAGQTVIGVADADRVIGWIALADTLKPDAVAAVKQLQDLGLRPALVTGDNPRVAAAIASAVGIQEVRASALPGDKVEALKAWQANGEVVAFIGDGINDAPALKQADVGIAMGTGADIALEAADIAIAGEELLGAVRALSLSRATFRKIRQNLAWAYGYNLVMLPIAAAGLLHPIMAEVAMALSSLTVIWNSLQLKTVSLTRPNIS